MTDTGRGIAVGSLAFLEQLSKSIVEQQSLRRQQDLQALQAAAQGGLYQIGPAVGAQPTTFWQRLLGAGQYRPSFVGGRGGQIAPTIDVGGSPFSLQPVPTAATLPPALLEEIGFGPEALRDPTTRQVLEQTPARQILDTLTQTRLLQAKDISSARAQDIGERRRAKISMNSDLAKRLLDATTPAQQKEIQGAIDQLNQVDIRNDDAWEAISTRVATVGQPQRVAVDLETGASVATGAAAPSTPAPQPGAPVPISPAYQAAIDRYGPQLDAVAKRYGLTGKELMAQTFAAESRFDPKALSSAGAYGAAQFMSGTRNMVVEKTGGKIDPWSGDPNQEAQAMVMHMTGQLGHAQGLEGYNPGGGRKYVDTVLGTRVAGVGHGERPAAAPSSTGATFMTPAEEAESQRDVQTVREAPVAAPAGVVFMTPEEQAEFQRKRRTEEREQARLGMEEERLKILKSREGVTKTGQKETDVRQFSNQRRKVIQDLKAVRNPENAEKIDPLIARTQKLATGDWDGLDAIAGEAPAVPQVMVPGPDGTLIPVKPSQAAGIEEREKHAKATREASLDRAKLSVLRDLRKELSPEQLTTVQTAIRQGKDMEDLGEVIAASPKNQFTITLPDGTTQTLSKQEYLTHFYRTAPQITPGVETELARMFNKTRFDATPEELAAAQEAAAQRAATMQTHIAETRARALANVVDARDRPLWRHKTTLAQLPGDINSAAEAHKQGYQILSLKGLETVNVGGRLREIVDDMRALMLGGWVDTEGVLTDQPGEVFEGVFRADPGLFNRLIETGGNWIAALQQGPRGRGIRAFEALIEQYLAIWSRGFSGETGHTTEGDVGRAQSAFASALARPPTGLTDTREYAMLRQRVLSEHVEDLIKRAFGEVRPSERPAGAILPWRRGGASGGGKRLTPTDIDKILEN